MNADGKYALTLTLVILSIAAAYVLRLAVKGRARFDRTERQGGSWLLGQGIIPVGRLWVAKLIIDGIIAALAAGQPDLGSLLPLVLVEFALTALSATLQPISQSTQIALGHRGG